MTIHEKALKLAQYVKDDDYYDLNDVDLIQVYSSFDKLMELFEEINSYSFEDGYYIIIESFYVYLKHTGRGLIKNYEYNRNGIILKKALMDCLLEYYKQTKGV